MIQAAHHHCPNTRFQKYDCSISLAAVPRDEELGEVRAADHERREEAELRGRVEHVDRDVVLELEPATDRDDDREDHADAGEDRAGHEVRREDRRVPARQVRPLRSRTTPTECTDSTSGVENAARKRYARAKCRHSTIRVAPPEREHAVDLLAERIRLAVAQRGEVGDQSDEEERRRDGQVREDREHVPDQRTLELRPDEAPVRIRNQPEELPRPSRGVESGRVRPS